jgi:hypothetical protein
MSWLKSREIDMVYIPSDAEWYLADLIITIHVEDDPKNIIHINTVLVHAQSPEDAYEKALSLGAEQVSESYLNPQGKQVEFRFAGLKELSVIHDKLQHGAELFFVEKTNMTPLEVASMVQPKENLSVFSNPELSSRPDFSSGQITVAYKKAIGEL